MLYFSNGGNELNKVEKAFLRTLKIQGESLHSGGLKRAEKVLADCVNGENGWQYIGGGVAKAAYVNKALPHLIVKFDREKKSHIESSIPQKKVDEKGDGFHIQLPSEVRQYQTITSAGDGDFIPKKYRYFEALDMSIEERCMTICKLEEAITKTHASRNRYQAFLNKYGINDVWGHPHNSGITADGRAVVLDYGL